MSAPQPNVLLQQALQAHQRGQLDKALQLYAQVRATNAHCLEAQLFAGEITLGKGLPTQAIPLLLNAAKIAPGNPTCLLRLGQALMMSGRNDQALQLLTQAVTKFSGEVKLWRLLASALQRAGRVREAIDACKAAIAAGPLDAEAHDQLGALLVNGEGHTAGEPYFRRATELNPREAMYWCNLGICIAYRKDVAGAIPCFDKAIELNPALGKAYAGKGLAFERTYRMAEAVASYRQAINTDPLAWDARSCLLLNLHYLPEVTKEEILAEHRAYGDQLAKTLSAEPPLPPTTPLSGRRIRVGFLSPDFRAHSVAYFMAPLLTLIDRQRFELFLYHDHATVDSMSKILQPMATTWRHTAGIPNDRLATTIREDRLDILFDLAGHTGFNRLHTLGRRLATVQATYMGYPDTTGLHTMDYRLTDAMADPLGEADPFAVEQLLRFSPCAWCYAPNTKAPDPSPVPCLGTGAGVTFGCFNNFTKVTDDTLAAWGRLLERVSNSRILIKNHSLNVPDVQALVRKRCLACGLDPDRLVMLGRTERIEDHLGTYSQVDVALDTFPYHGTTTTCEALWMGVPVITLAGDRHSARVGCSILTATGHPEWIAKDWEEYVAKAAELAADTAALTMHRASLREKMRASILCDASAQAGNFMRAIEEMIERGPRPCA